MHASAPRDLLIETIMLQEDVMLKSKSTYQRAEVNGVMVMRRLLLTNRIEGNQYGSVRSLSDCLNIKNFGNFITTQKELSHNLSNRKEI